MRLATFTSEGRIGFGSVVDDVIRDIAGLPHLHGARGLAEALGRVGVEEFVHLSESEGISRPLASVDLLPPVTDPQRIMLVGMNYKDHLAEAKMAMPDYPSIFVRFGSSFVGHGTAIVAPQISEQFDFEGEIALVIGTAGYRISSEDALSYVLGVTILADNSIRDWQMHSRQATPGKNFAASGAIGPWIVTREAIANINAIPIVTRLNGKVVQSGSTRDLIFSADQVIAYISSFTPLSVGDVIALGTPAGVGMGRTPRLWLKPGDRLDIEALGIGTLTNRVEAETAGVKLRESCHKVSQTA